MTPVSPATQNKLEELASTSAHATVVGEIRRLLTEGADLDCYKVNAFRVAAALGVPRPEALRGLLFATRLGLFDLNWDVRCPACTGTPEYHRTLMQMRTRAHCGLCDLGFDVDFEEQVEVTFTANPDVR